MSPAVLAGAGAGDWRTLPWGTLQALRSAEVVLYDTLLDRSILCETPLTAELIDVGKRAGAPSLSQEQICRLLVDRVKQGRRTVRLKGGDPGTFGRLDEELAALDAEGLPRQVIPAATAAAVTAAAGGFSLTLRGVSRSLTLATLSGREGAVEPQWIALAREGGTLAFYMSVGQVRQLSNALVGAGLDKDTPALAAHNAGRWDQQLVWASLADLPQAIERARLVAPALICVGQALADAHPVSGGPLTGACLFLPQPAGRASALVEPLRDLGACVYHAPLVTPEPLSGGLLPDGERALCFSSPYAVDAFVAALGDAGLTWRDFPVPLIAPGESTAGRLRFYGQKADVTARGSAVSLLDLVPVDWSLCFVGNEDNSGYGEALRRGRDARLCALYREQPCPLRPFAARALETEVGASLFSSAAQVRAFAACSSAHPAALCIGPKTAEQARRLGFETFAARQASFSSLIDLAMCWHRERSSLQ